MQDAFPDVFSESAVCISFFTKNGLVFSMFCAIFCPKYETLFFHICGCISEYLVLAIEVGRLGHHNPKGTDSAKKPPILIGLGRGIRCLAPRGPGRPKTGQKSSPSEFKQSLTPVGMVPLC